MSSPRIGRRVMEEHRVTEEMANSVLAASSVEEVSPASSHPVVVDDPEAAGLALLPYLPEDVQNLIREASQHMAIPIWQMLLGYTMRMHEMGELFVPYILAATWEAGMKANEPRLCQTCHLNFRSRFPSAEYCCPPCHFGKLEQFGHAEDCPTHG